MPLLLQVQVGPRYLHKSVRSRRLPLVLTVGLDHRSSNSRTRVLRRRLPPVRPVFPLLGGSRMLEVSTPACLHLVPLVKELLHLSTVSLVTFVWVEAEEFS
jgi:hypothetical protein